MKITFLLWVLPSISAYLYSIKDVDTKCAATVEKIALRAAISNGYTTFYAIPAETDTKANFETIKVTAGTTNTQLVYPENERITSNPTGEGDVPQFCYTTNAKPDVNGAIYFVEKDYADMDVYESNGKDYTVEIGKKYTTIFSPKSTGSTLGSFIADKDTSFQIYSGLPGDGDNLIFQYDSTQKVDELYIAQSYFYVLKTGGTTFNFTVSDKIVDPSTTTFGLNGFIMSPNFPSAPTGNYLDLKVPLKARTVEKRIKVKVSAIQSPVGLDGGEEHIVLAEETSVTVKIGGIDGKTTTILDKLSTDEFDGPLPTTANTIEIVSVNSAYTVQFDIEDVPTSSTAAPSSTTKPTVTPKPVTSGTCPPTTCPVVTCPTTNCSTVSCPTATPCSCLTSTTEISTTTMGAATSSVASIITICIVYSLF